MATTAVSTPVEQLTPEQMAAAKVPFALAFWYHMTGRRLRRYSEWDIERIMQVRMQIAECGA